MQTISAILDVTDPEMKIIQDMTEAFDMKQADFLGRCLARGLLVVAQEYQDAKQGLPCGPLALEIRGEEDLPF